MPQNYLKAVCQPNQSANPLLNFLQARLTLAEKGKAVMTMPISPNLRQGAGLVAGGILATLADECMAHAVLSELDSCQRIVTTEMNIRFLRATDPEAGGKLEAEAHVIKKGRTLRVAEASVRDSNNTLLAIAGASFFIHLSKETP